MRQIKAPITPEQASRAKVRITTHLDDEVIEELRRLAHKSGSKYQTMLNQILREALFDEDKGLISRIEKLEKAVFKKRAA